ncbi:MAG: chemotaxis protein CheD, partial [Bacteroidales bacterium]|nr:chemotaxis protein CheD [Bacteroidales bacterium]
MRTIMYTSYNFSLGKNVIFLHPGEYYSSDEDIFIGTLLGSCISVVLYDPHNGIGGLNHFMLPSSVNKEFYLSKSGKYGMYAMELLINSLMKMGVDKSDMKAKIFGGASVLRQTVPGLNSVSKNNIDFAFEYL